MFDSLKVGATLYHIVSNNVIATKITEIDSNDKGIYVFATDEKGETYRFIVILYSTGKTHFGNSLFVRLADYMKTV